MTFCERSNLRNVQSVRAVALFGIYPALSNRKLLLQGWTSMFACLIIDGSNHQLLAVSLMTVNARPRVAARH